MNVENLKKLALFLWDLPEEDATQRFDMGDFNTEHSSPLTLLKDKHVCNTVSCGIGWGPTAGILPTSKDRWWTDYSDNHFASTGTKEWHWMFSSCWAHVDNTPKGVCKRIMWLLEKGSVPEVYNSTGRITLEGVWHESMSSGASKAMEKSVELYKDWIPDAIQSRDSLRVPVLDQNQPPEGGDLSQPSFSDPV